MYRRRRGCQKALRRPTRGEWGVDSCFRAVSHAEEFLRPVIAPVPYLRAHPAIPPHSLHSPVAAAVFLASPPLLALYPARFRDNRRDSYLIYYNTRARA